MMRHDDQSEVRPASLWFGVLGGAGAWTVHLLGAYLIAEFGCETGTDRHTVAGIMLPAWLLLALTALMLAIGVASTWIALRLRGRLRATDDLSDPRIAAPRHLAHAGFLTSGLFTLIILIQSAPIFFYLQRCGHP
jgi:hypothetical protein